MASRARRCCYHKSMESFEARIKLQAHAVGFELAGIASAAPADGFSRMRDWLTQGYAGEMTYMHRQAEARREPSSILPNVQSVVMVATNYHVRSSSSGNGSADKEKNISQSLTGRVSRYAWGGDYHDILRARLNQLLAWIQQQPPGCQGRAVVDTAPLLRRDLARRAGLGWFGQNAML